MRLRSVGQERDANVTLEYSSTMLEVVYSSDP